MIPTMISCVRDDSGATRINEVAAILAAGIIRLRSRPLAEPAKSIADPTFPILSEAAATCLEVPGPTVLTVSRAVNNLRDPEIWSTK